MDFRGKSTSSYNARTMEYDERFINDLVRNTIEEANRNLPIYKKINGFTLRKDPFEKNGQQKIKRFLYSPPEEGN